jgi:hypothetical protein
MYYLVDNKMKIIFCWSAKCGCTHIKYIYWYFQTGIEFSPIHTSLDFNELPNDIENYTILMFIRNPYERLISGFRDKYNINGTCRYLYESSNLTFVDFVNNLIKSNFTLIDEHHFEPQIKNNNEIEQILKSKNLTIYDINNINYKYIEELYNKNIPDVLLNFKGDHIDNRTILYNDYVYNMNIDEYNDKKVYTKYFYNTYIKNKIYNFYKEDFIFFEKNGFNYEIKDEYNNTMSDT